MQVHLCQEVFLVSCMACSIMPEYLAKCLNGTDITIFIKLLPMRPLHGFMAAVL